MQAILPEELVRWCQATLPDDTRAFEYLVTQYKQRVYTIAYRLMGNPQEAEDQAQEVFLKVYRGIRKLEQGVTLTAWLDRITVNTCYDALEKQKRRLTTAPYSVPDEDGNDEPRYADTRSASPEDAALNSEIRRCLETALSQMDALSRATLVLRDIEDRSYQEIVDVLGIGLSAVKMRIHRARLAFQSLLETVCPGVGRGAA